MLGQFSINSVPYQIVDQSRLRQGARSYRERMRPSQSFESSIVQREWAVWGPLGRSRAGWNEQLGIDYCVDLDHRYDWLLTSTAKRNAVTLTAITAYEYLDPDSDVQKTSWSEGAGDADADAFDEVDEGGLAIGSPGSSDDATTYWTTSTNAAEIIFGLDNPVATPTDDGSGFPLNYHVRFRNDSGGNYTIKRTLYQGATEIASATTGTLSGTGWFQSNAGASSAQFNQITDFTALRVGFQRVTGTGNLDLTTVEVRVSVGSTVRTIDEDRGQVFVQRGDYSTQLNPADMTEVENIDHGSPVTDSVIWNGAGYVALGTDDAIQKRTAVAPSGSTYANVTDNLEASRMAVGPDRLWTADPDNNKLYFYVGDSAEISSANQPNATVIIDPATGELTGLYTFGEYMVAATKRGPRSFTDDGAPAVLGEATQAFPSIANGASGGTLWGWHYEASKLGLFAYRIRESGTVVENPVGPGEGIRGQAFEGPIDGYPTAVFPFKDSLWVAYLNPDGNSYVFRGTFGPETDATGRPEWFSFRRLPSLTCSAIGGTAGRDEPAVILGEDDDIAYYDLSTRGREIADSSYLFDTGGGTAFLTTLMLPEGAQANLRWAKLFTENCVDATDTWTVAVDVDDSGSYTNVGSAIVANGLQTVRPASTTTISSFTSIKPRLTQVASSETAPPQIRGSLTLAFDLRPDMVREVEVVVELKTAGDLAALQALESDDTRTAVAVRLPTDTAENTDRYAYIKDVTVLDRTNPSDMLIQLTIVEWELT